MKVFVTGATGFVGSHLVRALTARGDQVVCLTRSRAKLERLFAEAPPPFVEGTLDDADALASGSRDADVVFHVAGLTAARSRGEFLAVNANATRSLLKIVARAAPNLQRFVYVSSLAAAGPGPRGRPRTENDRAQPVSSYGWSKLAGEESVRQSGMPWTIVRPPTVYGPGDTEVLKVFKLAKWGVVPLFGDGRQENNFVYGPDLADALIAAAQATLPGNTYFAAHPEIATQRDLANVIYRAVRNRPNEPTILPIPGLLARGALWVTGTTAWLARRATILTPDRGNDFLAESWACSPEALTRDAGWRAQTDLQTGIASTAEWYRRAGWL